MLPLLQNVLKCDTGGDWTEKAPQATVQGCEGRRSRSPRQTAWGSSVSLLMGLLNDVDGLRWWWDERDKTEYNFALANDCAQKRQETSLKWVKCCCCFCCCCCQCYAGRGRRLLYVRLEKISAEKLLKETKKSTPAPLKMSSKRHSKEGVSVGAPKNEKLARSFN